MKKDELIENSAIDMCIQKIALEINEKCFLTKRERNVI